MKYRCTRAITLYPLDGEGNRVGTTGVTYRVGDIVSLTKPTLALPKVSNCFVKAPEGSIPDAGVAAAGNLVETLSISVDTQMEAADKRMVILEHAVAELQAKVSQLTGEPETETGKGKKSKQQGLLGG